MTSITGRYSASPETTMESDLSRLRNPSGAHEFIDALNKVINDTLTNDFWEITLVNDLETSSARSPALLAYYAALNNLGAPILFSHTKVSELLDPTLKPPRSPIERHHLFPRGYLEKIGIDDLKLINQAANFTFIEWGDNAGISDRPPAEYSPLMVKGFKLQSEELKRMHRYHALPEGWHEMPYPEFLEKRRRLLANVIRKGFETLSKPPHSANRWA